MPCAIASVNLRLDEMHEQAAAEIRRMYKADPGTATAGTANQVDHAPAFAGQPGQKRVDIARRKRDMRQAGAAARHELGDGALVAFGVAFFMSELLPRFHRRVVAAVGHQKFSTLLCMRWEGGTCQKSNQYLFATEPATALTYADLMGLDRVVLIKHAFPQAPAQGAPVGWDFVLDADPLAWVLERTTPRPAQPGRVVASPGVTVTDAAASRDTAESMTVSSPDGGSVVFSRLLWPGYTAMLDGRAVPVESVEGVFVAIRLPAGTQAARLELSFRPPGTTLGLTLAAGGGALLTLLVALDSMMSRRRRRRPAEGGS